ncbi:hypothetical protein BJ508DRAFT_302040 [Ascobolus immersus RN42]|uniref:Uncharacterized protein n=1 Tax=Ascobolus immersus RN42 TaxID=1160509 RepID=A0A3N4IL34_ASCIM|nr:hypothetical protein BJ508DRAFT_302040 [Ascobolus immersus RN42]
MTSTETSRVIPPAGPEMMNRNKTSPKRAAPDEPMPDAGSPLPKIVVKKEPASPIAAGPPSARHRPPKLSLNKTSGVSHAPRTSGALTAGGSHLMQEVGMACLSPGFTTQDPAMREQLARSISVRDQQRSIIEQRLQRHSGNGPETGKPEASNTRGDRSSKRRPPSSLTIVPPSHRAFANERVIQSAPLNQTFTGRDHPYQPSHLRQQQSQQTVNRLPPIADVFAGDRMDLRTPSRYDPAANNKGPQTTTGQSFPPPFPAYPSPNQVNNNRPREFRSAEEAINTLTGGREELHPKVVHYGGHQPPTPPSPPQGPAYYGKQQQNGPPTSRRRDRNEYERDGRDGSYGSDDNGTKRRKKEEKKAEFLDLCARAWDLLHS